jgi:hypothetical protein
MKKTAQTTLTLALTLLFLGICNLLFAVKTNAQSALGLTAIPPRIEISGKPGQIVTKEIKVRNESAVERFISTNVSDFIVTDENGTPVKITDAQKDNRWASSQWITVSPNKSIKLKPGETKALNLIIIIPENATAGGHYAMVLHTPNNEAVVSQTSSYIETNVGTLVYITVDGKIKQEAKIDYFKGPKFQEYGPVDFKSAITNSSDIHINPTGSIKITNMLGGKTANLIYNDKDYNIFPLTSRIFENTLNKKFLFGRYKATINAAYGTAGGALTATVFFWVIPWRLILLLISAITIIILLVFLFKQPTIIKEKEDTIDDLEKELEKLKKKYRDSK